MHTFFSRLPAADAESFVRLKLRRQAVETKLARDPEVRAAFDQTIARIVAAPVAAVPITGKGDHVAFSAAQRAVFDECVRCAVETLKEESPLAPGERIKDDFFSYLATDYCGVPVGTGALRRRTDRAEIVYLFNDFTVGTDGEISTVPPPAFSPSDIAAPPALRLRRLDTTGLAKSLASGIASGFGGQIGALIFDSIFPPGVPDYFDEVYAEIGKIVGGELTQSTVDSINGELNGAVRWLRQTYKNLKQAEAPPPRAELFSKLEPYVVAINTRVIGPLMEKRYEKTGFSVFMIAAPVHLGLLQEQALIDPNQPVATKSAYAKAAQGYAKIYSDHATRVLAQLVKKRREKVVTKYTGEWISDMSQAGGYTKPAYSWRDQQTNEWGQQHSEYTKDKKYHSGKEEADRDRNVRRGSVEQALRRDLGYPTKSISDWRQLIARPIPNR